MAVIKLVSNYYKFECINLFYYGKSRISRLLLNFELLRSRYTPIIIKNKEREKYYEVLDIARTIMDYEPFIKLVSELIIESEKLWLSILG